jgi:hypothetical protein
MVNDQELNHELSSRRDAVQFTKEFSLFILRTCILLNGGAILAILTLLSTLVSHPDAAIVIRLRDVKIALALFAAGLIATLIAGIFGYQNFLLSQKYDRAAVEHSMKRARLIATYCGVAAVILFIVGVACVISAVAER